MFLIVRVSVVVSKTEMLDRQLSLHCVEINSQLISGTPRWIQKLSTFFHFEASPSAPIIETYLFANWHGSSVSLVANEHAFVRALRASSSFRSVNSPSAYCIPLIAQPHESPALQASRNDLATQVFCLALKLSRIRNPAAAFVQPDGKPN